MNPLVKKEIRLLLPVFTAVLAWEALWPWIWQIHLGASGYAPIVFGMGMVILAVASFGREFSQGTFLSLMSQPVERGRIWWMKTIILFAAATLIFATYVASCGWRSWEASGNSSAWMFNHWAQRAFWKAMLASGVVGLVALAGGLWTALLFRQTAAAFWITLLTPIGLMVSIALIMSEFFSHASGLVVESVLYGAAGIYGVAGFWLAHRLFHRAQDVAWTGGVITLSTWQNAEAATQPGLPSRRRKPMAALFKKECQLHAVTLLCAGVMLLLHCGVFLLRIYYANYHRFSAADFVSDFFWMLWLVLPLTIGCVAVAEERKLGVVEGQFCLPVSRRTQFACKFIVAMLLGTLLGGVIPVLLEASARHFGAPNGFFRQGYLADNEYGSGVAQFQILIIALAAGFSLAAFVASTFARNFLQALSVAIVIIVGCFWFGSVFVFNHDHPFALLMILMRWQAGFLDTVIAIPVIIVVGPWLIYRNFSYFQEGGRLWLGHLKVIVGAFLFVTISSAVIYNRPWEIFEAAEPPHGPAILSMANRPVLVTDSSLPAGVLQVRFPDGRVWFDSRTWAPWAVQSSSSPWKLLWSLITYPNLIASGPQQYIAGSNWLSVSGGKSEFWGGRPLNELPGHPAFISGYQDTVGIKSNGTLWISSESKPDAWTGNQMIQFGDKTNWCQVVNTGDSSRLILLKTDGTLWRWESSPLIFASDGNNMRVTGWPTFRNSTPERIGTDSDWTEISGGWPVRARKRDGSVWVKNIAPTGADIFDRDTNYDGVVFQTLSGMSYVGKDGTLWVQNYRLMGNNRREASGFLQVGTATNWVATGSSWGCLVALKSDGTLWRWKLNPARESAAEAAKNPPTRLGIHNDWVGLTTNLGEIITLAADGSLWLWPQETPMELLKPPKQPQLLALVREPPDDSGGKLQEEK